MSYSIRLFTPDDIDPALRLCRAAGWNQLHDDWHRLITYQPDGCFVAEVGGQIAGTVTTTSYGRELAWIGMMLVDPNQRRRGIATALMNMSMEHLVGRGTQCIKLDATPEGRFVYQKLGFQAEWNYQRWHHHIDRNVHNETNANDFALEALATLDLEAFGVDRSDWLSLLASGSVCDSNASGFGMTRPGHLATYLGPVMSADVATADEIVKSLLAQSSGRLFWDVPQPNWEANRLAERLGFLPLRDLTRMYFGTPLSSNLDLQYALCDPGTG